MAEIAEVFEVIEEAEGGIADEAEEAGEDMDPEEKAEFESEVADVTNEVDELSKTAKVFKTLMEGSLKALKSFVKFAVHNAAVGTILYFVNVGLSKLTKTNQGEGQQANKEKLAIVKAIILLIKTETNMCNAIKDWLQTHKDDTVTLDGIEIKLEAIFETQLKPISDAIELTYNTAKQLMTKKDGKTSFNIPKVADINNLLNGSVSFLQSLGKLKDFAETNKEKVVSLQSLLEILTQEALDDIQKQLDDIKKMPIE
ncbi:unnamed protein product [Mytilus coruscus]|uniref:Uncharacterized protein n=1 Tax=Mytilus coruscus TaxID=42192 RepID=A0A6J8ALY1_MYTCO|nr:unnamed protein product [Mytilus coruscus]